MVTAFTVDRATWLHGEGADNSYLFRGMDGKKCCLGFLALACDVPVESILQRQLLSRLEAAHWVLLPETMREASHTLELLMELNDVPLNKCSTNLQSDEDREQRLAAVFKKLDIDVTFTGPSV